MADLDYKLIYELQKHHHRSLYDAKEIATMMAEEGCSLEVATDGVLNFMGKRLIHMNKGNRERIVGNIKSIDRLERDEIFEVISKGLATYSYFRGSRASCENYINNYGGDVLLIKAFE